jgi:hypothetical protein
LNVVQKKYAAIILTLSFLIFPLMAGSSGVSCQIPTQTFMATAVWGSTTSPLVAYPGSSNLPLYIAITNLGPLNMTSGLNITFEASYPLIPLAGESSNLTQYVPVLLAGYSIPLIGYYSVASGTYPGIYNETVLVSYEYFNGIQYVTQSQTINVSVPVLAPSLPAQSFQATAIWGSPQSPMVASPGASNLPLYIAFTNLGPSTATGVTATFEASYPLIPLAGESSNLTQYVPAMTAGVSVPMIGYYAVASNARQGIYNETVLITYNVGLQATSQAMNISIALLGPTLPSQSFQATAVWGSLQSPLTASPGSSDLPLLVTVYNAGPSAVFNFSASFQPSNPLIPIAGESQSINSTVAAMTAGSSVQLLGYFNVSDAASNGVCNQSLVISYSNGTQTFADYLSVEVPILGSPDIEVSGFTYVPTLIYPGYSSSELEVVLSNMGTATASNVNLSLSTSYPVNALYQGATTKYLGYLPVGQPVTVLFPLGITNSTLPENTTLYLQVSYNGAGLATFGIPFNESPKAVLQVVSISSPTIAVGDGSDYITLDIQNTGSAAAEYATLTFIPSNVFQPYISSSASPLLATTYLNSSLGTIEPGQQVNVTYIISVSPNIVAGSYPLDFVATWSQGAASYPFAQQFILPISVGASFIQVFTSPFSSPLFLLILALLVVLIVVAIIVIIRGRRKKK